MQVWRHRLGTRQADDTLVYEEQDSGWFTHLHESSSGRFCVIAGGDHETSEQRLIDLANPDAPPRLVAAREEGVQYSIADRGDELFILTNADDAIDFKVVTAPLAAPERANWRDLIPYREGVYVLDVELYAGHMVRLERANAHIEILLHRDPKQRVVHYLRQEASNIGISDEGAVRIPMHVQVLAEQVGLSLEEIDGVLRKLERGKLVRRTDDGEIEIPELKKLQDFLDFLEIKERFSD